MGNRDMPKSEDIIRMDYPSNSKSPKQPQVKTAGEKPKSKPIVKGKVSRRKQKLSKRFSEAFFNEDTQTIGSYVVHDVIIPSVKNMLYDMVLNSLGMSLFGHALPNNMKRHGGSSSPITNYRSMSTPQAKSPRTLSKQSRTVHKFDEIVLEHRWEAEEVISKLQDYIEIYDQATVGDLYDLLDISSTFADRKHGWTNISTARVVIDRAGYVLELPPTEVL